MLSGIRKLHFIGIGGVGMSALAHILLDKGWSVSGSDLHDTPLTRELAAAGAEIYTLGELGLTEAEWNMLIEPTGANTQKVLK